MVKVICFDLDDTLSKEIRYLESAYKEIAGYAASHCDGCSDPASILSAKAYQAMLDAYHNGENAFERLNEFLGLQLPVSDYLQIYRNHQPSLELLPEVKDTLNKLKEDGCVLGLISDGRSVQQRSKFNALGLNKWIDADNVIISEEFGSEKPSLSNYEYFMKRYPSATYVYVGDNPKKDFVGANELGWETICLLDDGENIHKQEFGKVKANFHPKIKIITLDDLLKCI